MPCMVKTTEPGRCGPPEPPSGRREFGERRRQRDFLEDNIDRFVMARMISINDSQGNVEGYRNR